MKILLLDKNHTNAAAIATYLVQKGYKVYVESVGDGIVSRVKNTIVLGVERSDENFLEVLDVFNIDLILPVSASSILYCTQNAERLGKLNVVKGHDAVKITQDKLLTYSFCISENIPVAPMTRVKSYSKNSVELLDDSYVRNISEGDKNHPGFLPIGTCINNYSTVIAQKRLTGRGAGYFAILDNRKILCEYSHERILEYPTKGGVSSICKLNKDEDVLKLGREVACKLNYSGPVMVEFKRDGEGLLYLVEINLKFWGSIGLAFSNGIPIIDAFIKQEKITYKIDAFISYIQLWSVCWKYLLSIKTLKDMFFVLSYALNNEYKTDYIYGGFLVIKRKLLRFIPSFITKVVFSRSRSTVLRYLIHKFCLKTGFVKLDVDHVIDNIYIGCSPRSNSNIYNKYTVISLQSEKRPKKGLWYPAEEYQPLSIEFLKKISSKIQSLKGGVYIHCREGRSRAAAVVVAFLITHKDYTLDAAVNLVNNKRSLSNILPSQLAYLKILSNELKK